MSLEELLKALTEAAKNNKVIIYDNLHYPHHITSIEVVEGKLLVNCK